MKKYLIMLGIWFLTVPMKAADKKEDVYLSKFNSCWKQDSSVEHPNYEKIHKYYSESGFSKGEMERINNLAKEQKDAEVLRWCKVSWCIIVRNMEYYPTGPEGQFKSKNTQDIEHYKKDVENYMGKKQRLEEALQVAGYKRIVE